MKLLNKIFIMLSILFILSPIPSKALEDSPKKYVYLTFDDGPTKGNTPMSFLENHSSTHSFSFKGG